MFFLHQIRMNSGTVKDKGIASKDTLDAAKQSYHAYLSAYAYGHEQGTDMVHCMVTEEDGSILLNECWKPLPQPEPEPNAE